MKKAAAVLETVLLLSFVVIVSIALIGIYNKTKMNLVNMSNVTIKATK